MTLCDCKPKLNIGVCSLAVVVVVIYKLVIVHDKYMFTFTYNGYLLGEPILDKQ